MRSRKEKTILLTAGACMLLATFAAMGWQTSRLDRAKNVNAEESVTLDSENAPTQSTGFVSSVDYQGIPYATYTFTKVRKSEGNLCELDAFGTISKDEAYGLKSITVNYTNNSLVCATKFDKNDSETLFFDIKSGVETTIYGNYFTLFNAANNPSRGGGDVTVIESINLKYDCQVAAVSMENEGFVRKAVADGEDYAVTYTKESTSEVVEGYDIAGSYKESQLVLASNTGGATLEEYDGEIGGHSNPIKFYDADADWGDKIRIADTNASTYKEIFKKWWKYNLKYFSFDLYLTSGSYVRVYSNEYDGNNHFYGKIFTAGGTISGAPSSTTSGNSTRILTIDPETNSAVTKTEANKWYRVVVDISEWKDKYAVGYPYIQTDYEKGTIYFDNIRCYHECPLEYYVKANNKTFNLINDESLKVDYPMLYNDSSEGVSGNMDATVLENGVAVEDYDTSVSSNAIVTSNKDVVTAVQNKVGTASEEITFAKDGHTAVQTINVDIEGNQFVSDASDFIWANTSPAHVGSYSKVDSAFGRENVYKAIGNGVWNDELGLSVTSRVTGTGATQTNVIRKAGITHFAYDILLGTSSSYAKLQTNVLSQNATRKNLIQVGKSYQGFNGGTFNSLVHVYKQSNDNWVEILENGETFEQGVWYRVVVDYSQITTTYNGGYLDVNVYGFAGEVYLDNVHYLRVR